MHFSYLFLTYYPPLVISSQVWHHNIITALLCGMCWLFTMTMSCEHRLLFYSLFQQKNSKSKRKVVELLNEHPIINHECSFRQWPRGLHMLERRERKRNILLRSLSSAAIRHANNFTIIIGLLLNKLFLFFFSKIRKKTTEVRPTIWKWAMQNCGKTVATKKNCTQIGWGKTSETTERRCRWPLTTSIMLERRFWGSRKRS